MSSFRLLHKKALSSLLALSVIGTMAASLPFSANATALTSAAPDAGVSYKVYGQSYAWSQSARTNGAEAGTEHQSKRIEALKVSLTGSLSSDASIVYQVHGQSYGWSQSAKADGAEAGTEHQSKRVEAIRITLKNMAGYAVSYRVYQQSYGWSNWATTQNGTDISNAAVAGVAGKSKRVEAIEIKLVNPVIKTTANVGTAAELSAALADSNIDTINFTANITASPSVSRPLTINFGAYTLTGDISFSYTVKGTSVLTGNTDNRIIGSLTVDTANASFRNGVKVSGKVTIANVEIGTWAELANGNMIFITDPDGSTLDITGHPVGVEVTASASGSTTIDVGAGGAVDSLTSSAPVAVAVSAGGTVASLTAGTGANGSTITNNGTIGTLTANAPINLVANVAPGTTVTTGAGGITVTGSDAGKVKPTPEAPVFSGVTNITVKTSGTSIVTPLQTNDDGIVLFVMSGTIVACLTGALQSYDGSTQLYAVNNSSGHAKTSIDELVSDDQLVVTAANGISKTSYEIVVLTSPEIIGMYGYVNPDTHIVSFPSDATYTNFINSTVLSPGATVKVYAADGINSASTLAVGNKITVTAGNLSNTYTIVSSNTGITVKSNQSGQTISDDGHGTLTVNNFPTAADLKSGVQSVDGSTQEYHVITADGNEKADSDTIASGDKFVSVSEDCGYSIWVLKVTYTYTIKVVNGESDLKSPLFGVPIIIHTSTSSTTTLHTNAQGYCYINLEDGQYLYEINDCVGYNDTFGYIGIVDSSNSIEISLYSKTII